MGLHTYSGIHWAIANIPCEGLLHQMCLPANVPFSMREKTTPGVGDPAQGQGGSCMSSAKWPLFEWRFHQLGPRTALLPHIPASLFCVLEGIVLILVVAAVVGGVKQI